MRKFPIYHPQQEARQNLIWLLEYSIRISFCRKASPLKMGFGGRYVETLLLFVENELYHQIGIDFVVEAYEMYMYI